MIPSQQDRTAQARQIANEAELAHGDRCFFKVRVNACECDLGKRRQRLESAILAALTAASAAKDWQPIATAPKDGTRVLVHIGSRFGLLIARWDSTAEAWMDDEPFAPDPQPTHWQPLPDPPSESR